jgi:hypothetical protein
MKFRLVVGCWLFLFSISLRAQTFPASASALGVAQRQDVSPQDLRRCRAKHRPCKRG